MKYFLLLLLTPFLAAEVITVKPSGEITIDDYQEGDKAYREVTEDYRVLYGFVGYYPHKSGLYVPIIKLYSTMDKAKTALSGLETARSLLPNEVKRLETVHNNVKIVILKV